MNAEQKKRIAAEAALAHVIEDTVIGIGTGSTVNHFIDAMAARKLRIRGAVSSSEASTARLKQHGFEVLDLNATGDLDLYVDGADESDRHLRLIKGGGGALTREKIVAAASRRMVVIADETKWVETLGAFPLPVEVTRFGFALTQERVREALRQTGCEGEEVVLRVSGKANEPVITDGGNYILDAHARRIPDAEALADALKRIAGVVEHGLFLGLAHTVILGKAKGAEIKQPR